MDTVNSATENLLYIPLAWDSEFFGFKVAKVLSKALTTESLRTILLELKTSGFRLVYWPTYHNIPPEIHEAALAYNGKLVDSKTRFRLDIDNVHPPLEWNKSDLIYEEYNDREIAPELIDLAIQSGESSRFNIDKGISNEQFKKLYSQWIINSVEKKVADIIFVVRHQGKIVAMITGGTGNNESEIGLLAVSGEFRGRGIGVRLIELVETWASALGIKRLFVTTQGENHNACRLYTKYGFHIDSIEDFYHFWL